MRFIAFVLDKTIRKEYRKILANAKGKRRFWDNLMPRWEGI
jgi:hypothetical protein